MRLLLSLLWLALFVPGPSSAITPSDQAPADADEPVLTVVQGGETSTASLADLEALGHYDFHMAHPEGPEGTYTGVRLNDVFAHFDLADASRVRVVAADDYTTYLTPDERAEREYMLVTRFEGEPVPRDTLGPLLLAVPEDAEAVREGELPLTRWVWSVVELRAR